VSDMVLDDVANKEARYENLDMILRIHFKARLGVKIGESTFLSRPPSLIRSSRSPRRDSTLRLSNPPIWSPSTKICGTVRRFERFCISVSQ